MRKIVRSASLLWAAAEIIRDQRRLIRKLDGQVDRLRDDKRDAELAYMRIGRDLIEQFLISMDQPELQDEIRPRLTQALGFYRDEIAVREEHVEH